MRATIPTGSRVDTDDYLGDFTADQLMKRGIARTHLGTVKTISETDPKVFARKLATFVDSKEKDMGEEGEKRKKGKKEKKDKGEKKEPVQEYVRRHLLCSLSFTPAHHA